MSALTATLPTALARHASIPFYRLVAAESRKFINTRIGLLLLALILVGGVTVMAGAAFALETDLQATVTMSGVALGTLLPVLGILTVTSEWSKRTALATFTLEPRRERVLVAKCVPAVMATIALSTLMLLLAVPIVFAAAASRGQAAALDLDPATLAGWVATDVILVLNGVAIGALLLNAPAAIVICVAAGVYWGFIGMAGEIGAALAHWLDLNRTTSPLLAGEMTVDAWAPLLVSVLAWIVLPFIAGVVRISHMEIR